MVKIESGLDAAEATLNWIDSLKTDLNLGLEALATGKLPPQLFKPSRLEESIGRDHKSAADGVELVVTWPEREDMRNLSESQSLLRAVQRPSPSFH